MTGDPLEMMDAAIEALRRGRALDVAPLHGQDDADVAALRVATLLALGAGRPPRPEPTFATRLEGDLLARQAAQSAGSGAQRRPRLVPRWPRLGRRVGVALVLPMLLAIALLSVDRKSVV